MSPHPTYFLVHADDKHGKPVNISGFYISAGDFPLMAIPAGTLSSSTPTAHELRKVVFKGRYKKTVLYNKEHAKHHLDSDDTVDLHKYGKHKDEPLLFVDKNDDAEENNDEDVEQNMEDFLEGKPMSHHHDHSDSNQGYSGGYAQPQVQTGNLCGDPACGRTYICSRDYNRNVQPLGYSGV
ncbi:hypothetical protein GALMADRAFT_249881 [Galerina marginata CBS 339.88]|uniref:Uncharacterized protein n=1 Tax=Galerina marginata (strain CBS 339.88) TaxID=685588 RepID=A0A067SVR5_GALM3|nr:hypothetical protein GALMADRAFT_249881 [Galerina marginata CBS 339.88]